MPKNGYNTGLAAEFFVLSILHRKGVDANLTLGNKKSVDIAAVLRAGEAITIDVKGSPEEQAGPSTTFASRKLITLLFSSASVARLTMPQLSRKCGFFRQDVSPRLLIIRRVGSVV